uniref:Uncharacterized protein n=1 Tax=Anguilla anguilla TaxID=7936 RepID=A0A0E9WSC9_ANGAN
MTDPYPSPSDLPRYTSVSLTPSPATLLLVTHSVPQTCSQATYTCISQASPPVLPPIPQTLATAVMPTSPYLCNIVINTAHCNRDTTTQCRVPGIFLVNAMYRATTLKKRFD